MGSAQDGGTGGEGAGRDTISVAFEALQKFVGFGVVNVQFITIII
jgi:hypothetical protein